MPDELLTILKFCLLALIYLFFFRVLRAVWAEINPSRVTPGARGRGPVPPAAPGAAPLGTYAGGPAGPAAPPMSAGPAPAGPVSASAPTGMVAAAGSRPGPGAGGPPVPDATGNGAAGAHARLVVVEPPALQGRSVMVDDEVTIGRAGQCRITLDDNFVSQRHARVFPGDGGYVVEDLGSTNGTYLNRTRLSGASALARGDRIQIGNTVLELV